MIAVCILPLNIKAFIVLWVFSGYIKESDYNFIVNISLMLAMTSDNLTVMSSHEIAST